MTERQAEELRNELRGFGIDAWLTVVVPKNQKGEPAHDHAFGVEYRGVTNYADQVPLVAARVVLTPEEADHLLGDLRDGVVTPV